MQKKVPPKIDILGFVPVILAHLLDRHLGKDAGGVDQDIEPAKAQDRSTDDGVAILAPADTTDGRQEPGSAMARNESIIGVPRPGADGDQGTLIAKSNGRRGTDTARSTRHQDLALLEAHRPSPHCRYSGSSASRMARTSLR
jgi:hypothetical protein